MKNPQRISIIDFSDTKQDKPKKKKVGTKKGKIKKKVDTKKRKISNLDTLDNTLKILLYHIIIIIYLFFKFV